MNEVGELQMPLSEKGKLETVVHGASKQDQENLMTQSRRLKDSTSENLESGKYGLLSM